MARGFLARGNTRCFRQLRDGPFFFLMSADRTVKGADVPHVGGDILRLRFCFFLIRLREGLPLFS